MSVVRRLLVLLLPTCLLVLIAPAPPAAACSCALSEGAADYVDWADTVFVGTLTEASPPPWNPVMSSGDPATYIFAVEAVYEGSAHETTEVASAWSGASCGLEGMQPGREYVVFASHETIEGERSEQLWANLCGGTRAASAGFVAEIETITGPGAPPTPGESPAHADTEALVTTTLLSLGGAAVAAFLTPLLLVAAFG